jgi:hypothetical protein
MRIEGLRTSERLGARLIRFDGGRARYLGSGRQAFAGSRYKTQGVQVGVNLPTDAVARTGGDGTIVVTLKKMKRPK